MDKHIITWNVRDEEKAIFIRNVINKEVDEMISEEMENANKRILERVAKMAPKIKTLVSRSLVDYGMKDSVDINMTIEVKESDAPNSST